MTSTRIARDLVAPRPRVPYAVALEGLLEVLQKSKGAARHEELRGVPRRALQRAVREGLVVRQGRGTYYLPTAAPERVAATSLQGVASHLSAARLHGWEIARKPQRLQVTVPRGRRIARGGRPLRPRVAGTRVQVHYGALAPDERRTGITDAVRTVLDCATSLPFGEALAVADSALRAKDVTQARLIAAADLLRGPGSDRARRVARAASDLAANPFESMLRALCLDIVGLAVDPQVLIRTARAAARVDLADHAARLVVEADSFTYHGGPEALARDIRRYDELVSAGWTVLRFSYPDVMGDPVWVQAVLTETLFSLRETGLGQAP